MRKHQYTVADNNYNSRHQAERKKQQFSKRCHCIDVAYISARNSHYEYGDEGDKTRRRNKKNEHRRKKSKGRDAASGFYGANAAVRDASFSAAALLVATLTLRTL